MWICQPNTCGSVSLPIDYFYIYKGTVGRDVIYGIGTQPNSLYLPLLCRSCVLPWRKLCQGGWSNSCWGWWWPPLSLTPIASDSPWKWEQITCYFNDHCNKHVIYVNCIFWCVITVCTVMWFEWMCGSLCMVCVSMNQCCSTQAQDSDLTQTQVTIFMTRDSTRTRSVVTWTRPVVTLSENLSFA
jgi:hypothetical protein